MRNKIGGRCYRCGKWCPPNEGFFERVGPAHYEKWPGVTFPKWIVQHADCAEKYKGTPRHYLHDPDILPYDGYDEEVRAEHTAEREAVQNLLNPRVHKDGTSH